MRLLLLLISFTAYAQEGLTITGGHPRIYFDPTRLAAAVSYTTAHPWTPSTIGVVNANSWAAHGLITNTPAECDSAIAAVKAFQLDLTKFTLAAGPGGATANQMRWYGEVAAEVYDWCYSQMSPTDAQLIRDRWIGTTANSTDPVHVPTDLASASGTSVITSTQSPFLPNMAGNNVIIFNGGGTHCPTDRFPILTVTDANTITVVGVPNSGGSASGCTARISGYVDAARFYIWGGNDMPWSNFFWGYWRNEILWSVAAYGETTYTPELLHDALAVRWPVALALYAGTGTYSGISQKGGIWTESSEYGPESFVYQMMPVLVCQRYGRDLTTETNWYREAATFAIYNATVQPTYSPNTNTSYYQMFPWGDDQDFVGYPPAASSASVSGYVRGNSFIVPPPDFVDVLAQIYGSSNLGKYFRQWVTADGFSLSPWIAGGDPGGSTLALTGLPLDYFSLGHQALFAKTAWATGATQIRIIGTMALNSHQHANSGDFAINRNGVRLTGEFTAYSQLFVCGGYAAAETSTPSPTCSSQYGYAHNIITLDSGSTDACQTSQVWGSTFPSAGGNAFVTGPGRTLRLDSQTNYSYMALDISDTYKSIESIDPAHDCRDHNPYAGTVQREYLFIRPTETLVIFDRILSAANYFTGTNRHPVVAAQNVVKRVLVHSPVVPTISGGTATWLNHGQKLKGWFLGPATPTLVNIDEGNFTGHALTVGKYQQRLEFSNADDVSNGAAAAQSYMVTILRAGDEIGYQDFTVNSLTDNGSTFTLRLDHPTGNILWVINKGATTNGGSFGYAASGTPTTALLNTVVNPPLVTDAGVTWPVLPLISASPQFLSFPCTVGGSNPAPQSAVIDGIGITLTNWSVSKSQPWLSLSPTTGSGGASTTATVDCTGLTEGIYGDSISVTSTDGVTNLPFIVPVSLTVNPAPVVTNPSLPNSYLATAYSQNLTATGGQTPRTWTIDSGTLCTGLTLSSAGLISGTPTDPAGCSFVAKMTDPSGAIATKPLSISVSPPPGTAPRGVSMRGVTGR